MTSCDSRHRMSHFSCLFCCLLSFQYIRLIHITSGWHAAGEHFVFIIHFNNPKLLYIQWMVKVRRGLDHQGEDNMQTQHWRRLWQLTEYYKSQTASGSERTLQATLHTDTIIVCHSTARRQIPTPQSTIPHIVYSITVLYKILTDKQEADTAYWSSNHGK